MKQNSCLQKICIVILAWSMATVAWARVHDGIAALVDDEVITMGELADTVKIARGRAIAAGVDMSDEDSFKKQILDMLVVKTLQLHQAKRHNVTVTKQEVSESVARIKAERHMDEAQFKAALAQDNLSYQDFLKTIEEQMILQKLRQMAVSSKIVVTDEEVRRAWAQAQAKSLHFAVTDYWLPLDDNVNKVDHDKAKQLVADFAKQLHGGSKVEDLLKTEELAQIKRQDMGSRLLEQMPAVFAEVVAKMKEHQVSSLIEAANGLHILVLEEKENALSKQQLQQQLYMYKLEEKYQHWLQQLRAATYVKLFL